MMPVLRLDPITDDEFDETCRAIAEGWRRKRGSGGQSAWLEAKVYGLADYLWWNDREEFVRDRVESLSKRGAPGRTSRYGRLLRVIFHGETKAPDNKARERIVNRLEFAWRHLVPPPFLAGFLLLAGARPKRDDIAVEFKDWIVDQLGRGRNQERQKEFPKAIRKLAKKRRHKRRM